MTGTELTDETKTHGQREQVAKEVVTGGGMGWEFRVKVHVNFYIQKWINSKVLLQRELYSISYDKPYGKEYFKRMYIYINIYN